MQDLQSRLQTIDWDKVRARIRTIIPVPAVIIEVEQAVRRELERMPDAEWEEISDKQQRAEEWAHSKATQRLLDTLGWEDLDRCMVIKTCSCNSAAAIREMVTELHGMSAQEWENSSPDRKAQLLKAINNAAERWMEQERRRQAASQDIKQTFISRWQKRKADRVWREVRHIVESLPPIAQSAVSLRKFHGYSVKKISEVLNQEPEEIARYLAQAAHAFVDWQQKK